MNKHRCPHCGKDYSKTPEELALLARIKKAASAIVVRKKYIKIKDKK